MLTVLSYLLAVGLGALASYLVLRNNPKYKTKVDDLADQAEAKLKK
jgi:hypothetical protein